MCNDIKLNGGRRARVVGMMGDIKSAVILRYQWRMKQVCRSERGLD